MSTEACWLLYKIEPLRLDVSLSSLNSLLQQKHQTNNPHGSGVGIKTNFGLSMSASFARIKIYTERLHVVASSKPLKRQNILRMRALSSAMRMFEFPLPSPKVRRNFPMAEATVCHGFSRQFRLLGRRYKLRHGASCVCLTVRRLSEEFEEYKRPQSECQNQLCRPSLLHPQGFSK